jgi:hypothetical protein
VTGEYRVPQLLRVPMCVWCVQVKTKNEEANETLCLFGNLATKSYLNNLFHVVYSRLSR